MPAIQGEKSSGYTGLTDDEVGVRVARGETNSYRGTPALSYVEIFRDNLLTRFNLLLGILFVAILVFGHLTDALFGIVVICNALIGIAQELRAKWTLERLSVLMAPRVLVWRNASRRELSREDVVQDDLVEVRRGDQIVADGVMIDSEGLLIDESLLTGESRSVAKATADTVMSGSFVVAGRGRYRVTAVGADSYANRITAEARRFVPMHSDLIGGTNRILRYIGWGLIPAAILLITSQNHVHPALHDLVTAVVAGLVAMVPQGLVLLTTIAFAVSAIRLARHNVLMQELAAVEGLARVDTICFDKTGTLTTGHLVFSGAEVLAQGSSYETGLAELAAGGDETPVLEALKRAFPKSDGWVTTKRVPFSSTTRWSGATFDGQGSWALGAVETLFHGRTDILERSRRRSSAGSRVLGLAFSPTPFTSPVLPADLQPVALLMFEEQLRSDAADTVGFLRSEGVDLKVISGDSGMTASFVAARVAIPGADSPLDGDQLPAESGALARAVRDHSVFGRVSPEQKREMVRALQSDGRTVAMIGDGVNDVLALKAADVGVAMGGGAAAARAVARVALLDGRFALMPRIIAEGRRVMANIERVSNLFITKTVWAAALALIVGLTFSSYPLLPRHLTIVDSLTIGIPSFFLALVPNSRRYRPGFVGRVAKFAIPAGITIALGMFVAFALAGGRQNAAPEQQTAAVVIEMVASLSVTAWVARPLSFWRIVLLAVMAASFVALLWLQPLRQIAALAAPQQVAIFTVAIAVATLCAIAGIARWVGVSGGAD